MKAKLHFVLSITIFFGGFYGLAQEGYWKQMQSSVPNSTSKLSSEKTVFELRTDQFGKVLEQIDVEKTEMLQLPDQQGNLRAFKVRETPVFHPDLAKKYPQIQSFTGTSVDGEQRVRFSYSPKGLQGTLLDYKTGVRSFIEKEDGTSHMYHVHQGSRTTGKSGFICSTMGISGLKHGPTSKNLVGDRILRKYRIAVSVTGEYTSYHGGTITDALTAINATLTRVNEVFETDLGVTLELVPNNDLVIFTNAATDPYTSSFNAQVQNTLSTIIGEENYDVGHLFHRDNDSGNAGFIGSVCVDNRKGSAFASALVPEGDLFDLDFVAHELGHQFGANHTWSFQSEGTGVQSEPASGTTIMGYAGIVESDNNVAPNGDDYFHHNSIVQIQDYLETTSCSQNTTLLNSPPILNPLMDHIIPKGTAFVLTGDATDVDGDVLTYAWEQIDNGVVISSTFGPDNVSGANFRSLPPTTESFRYFPRLSRILSGNLEQLNPITNDAWETVANVERELNFAVTVRDNNAEGGQVASDSVKISVVNGAGPFVVTSQNNNEVYTAGSVQDITWDVANTNTAPINAETVDILLSTDGGSSFSEVLAEDIPNTGLAQLQLPGIATTNARIMVRANNNVFFAINSSGFTIEESQAILNIDQLVRNTCQPNAIVVPFVYETYGGFSETMDLTVNTSVPFTISFSQDSVVDNGADVTLTLGNVENVPVGSHQVEVVATGPSFSTATVLQVNVQDDTFNDVVLTFPEDLAIGTLVNPKFTWQEDTNFSSFDIEIATDEAFTNIVESAQVSFNFYQSSALLPETTYYWRVKPNNPCGEGTFGSSFGFTTSVVNCKVFNANGQPLEISAEDTPTVRSSIFLVEDLVIADVNVNLELSHTFLEDLVVTLISPSGTRVALISKNCGDLSNINAVFDDGGDSINCSGNPAIGGIVKPLGSLSALNGESILGEWILEIEDTVPSDGGVLEDFSLEICVEGVFRPDDDEDGVFDDGDDLCLGTPKGVQVDTSGCPLNAFPPNNFSVSIQSEACRGNNDGAVSISALDTTIDYAATLSGNGIDVSNQFTQETQFANLSSGTYQLCINGSDGSINYRETCFEVVIEEPEELTVLANLLANEDKVNLRMSGGEFYTIELNGLATQTTESEITLNLNKGVVQLKVSTGLLCQGVFETQFFVGDAPVLLPNPTSDWVTITSQFQNEDVMVNVFGSDGRLVMQRLKRTTNFNFDLDVTRLSNGLYYLVMESNGVSLTTKMIKR